MVDLCTDQRDTLLIPMPIYMPRARGIHAKGKFGHFIKILSTEDEKELVKTAATYCGLSMAEFVRWVMLVSAKEVLRDVPEPKPIET